MLKWMIGLCLLSSVSVWAAGVENLQKGGVAIDGYDPVSYFKGSKPLKGDAKFQAKDGEAIYYFASEANKQEFIKEPKKFAPQFGGWCAYAVADSKSKVDVDPNSYVVQDGRLLLFYNGVWGNTREKWLHSKNKDSKAYLKEADSNWPATKLTEP